MEIQFVSTLTSEDEERLAGPLLKGIVAVLDQLPISYAIRIQTTGMAVIQHSRPFVEAPTTLCPEKPTASDAVNEEPDLSEVTADHR